MNIQYVVGILAGTWHLWLLPLVITLVVYFFLYRKAKAKTTLGWKSLKPSLIVAVAVLILFTIYIIYTSFTATNSTALLGLAGVALGAIPYSILTLLVIWAVLYIFYSFRNKDETTNPPSPRKKLLVGVAILFLLLLMGAIITNQYIGRLYTQAKTTTNIEQIQKYSHHWSDKVRTAVVYNPNTPLELLVGMSNDSYYGVRLGIALNDKTPPEVLDKLIRDARTLASAVAGNENTSIETLQYIATLPYGDRYVASNPKMPVDLLEHIAKTGDNAAKISVARNQKTPKEILDMLATDSYKPVRDAANISLRRLASESDSSAEENLTTYANQKFNFEFSYPTDLTLKELDVDVSTDLAHGPRYNSLLISITDPRINVPMIEIGISDTQSRAQYDAWVDDQLDTYRETYYRHFEPLECEGLMQERGLGEYTGQRAEMYGNEVFIYSVGAVDSNTSCTQKRRYFGGESVGYKDTVFFDAEGRRFEIRVWLGWGVPGGLIAMSDDEMLAAQQQSEEILEHIKRSLEIYNGIVDTFSWGGWDDTASVSFSGEVSVHIQKSGDRTRILYRNNGQDTTIDEAYTFDDMNADIPLGDRGLYLSPAFSESGRYIYYQRGWREGAVVHIYDTVTQEDVLSVNDASDYGFAVDDEGFFACTSNDFSGRRFANFYSVPDFKVLWELDNKEITYEYDISCGAYDDDSSIVRFTVTHRPTQISEYYDYQVLSGSVEKTTVTP